MRLRDDGSVAEFLEKPGPERDRRHESHQRRRLHPRALTSSTTWRPPERTSRSSATCFRRSSSNGLYGHETEGYWLDIGTPDRYLQATFDILEGNVRTDVGAAARRASARGWSRPSSDLHGRVVAPAIVGAGCQIAAHAIVGGRIVIGTDVQIGEGAHVESSVLLDGVRIGERASVHGSIIAAGSGSARTA